MRFELLVQSGVICGLNAVPSIAANVGEDLFVRGVLRLGKIEAVVNRHTEVKPRSIAWASVPE
jgi:hypothetical protein